MAKNNRYGSNGKTYNGRPASNFGSYSDKNRRRLNQRQLKMLLWLVGTRINQLTSQAVADSHTDGVRQQWQDIAGVLEERVHDA